MVLYQPRASARFRLCNLAMLVLTCGTITMCRLHGALSFTMLSNGMGRETVSKVVYCFARFSCSFDLFCQSRPGKNKQQYLYRMCLTGISRACKYQLRCEQGALPWLQMHYLCSKRESSLSVVHNFSTVSLRFLCRPLRLPVLSWSACCISKYTESICFWCRDARVSLLIQSRGFRYCVRKDHQKFEGLFQCQGCA